MSFFWACNLGFVQHSTSWFFNTSLAICGDEMTRTWFWPSCKSMVGPYFLEGFHRKWWLPFPIWWRLPMMGSFGGPGEGWLLSSLSFVSKEINDKERMRMSTRKMVGTQCNERKNRFIFFVWWCRKNTCVLNKLRKYLRLHVGLIFR